MDNQIETHELIARALDKLALALTAHDHQWSTEERALYERAIELCQAYVSTN
jgi:hypothetical protein